MMNEKIAFDLNLDCFVASWTKEINGKDMEYSYAFSGEITKSRFILAREDAKKAFDKKEAKAVEGYVL